MNKKQVMDLWVKDGGTIGRLRTCAGVRSVWFQSRFLHRLEVEMVMAVTPGSDAWKKLLVTGRPTDAEIVELKKDRDRIFETSRARGFTVDQLQRKLITITQVAESYRKLMEYYRSISGNNCVQPDPTIPEENIPF